MENTGKIHKGCATDRLKEFQHNNPNLSLTNIEFVKISFKEQGVPSEWMWIEVIMFNDDTKMLFGTLDSVPLQLTNIKINDEVNLSYDKIAQIIKFDNE